MLIDNARQCPLPERTGGRILAQLRLQPRQSTGKDRPGVRTGGNGVGGGRKFSRGIAK
jgi:hypothetical protein